MSIFADAWDTVTGTASDAASWVGDVTSSAADAVNRLTNSALGTALLDTITFAVSSAAFVGLAPIVGAQAASAAFAIPGVLEGKPVDKAWLQGFTDRLVKLANYFAAKSGGNAAAAQAPVEAYARSVVDVANDPRFGSLIDVASIRRAKAERGLSTAEALRLLGAEPESLAAKARALGLGDLRADVIADVLNRKLEEQVFDTSTFNPATGNRVAEQPDTPLGVLDKLTGQFDAAFRDLQKQKEAERAAAAAGKTPAPPAAPLAVRGYFPRPNLTSSSRVASYVPPAIVPQTNVRKTVATALMGLPEPSEQKVRELKLTAALLAPSIVILALLRMRRHR